MLNIWWALFFMALGGGVVWCFDRYAWRKYYEGKRESVNSGNGRR